MDAIAEIRLLLQSGNTLISVETTEETRLLAAVRAANAGGPLWTWSSASGLSHDGTAPIYGSTDPAQLFDNLLALQGAWTAILCDPGPVLADPTSVRRLKELAQRAVPGQSVVLVGAALALPPELDGLARSWRLPPPDLAELTAMVERVENRLGRQGVVLGLADADRLQLARALAGVTLVDAERILTQRGLADGRLDASDIGPALGLKAELLNTDGVLEVVPSGAERLVDLGGLDHLKEWLAQRLAAGLERAVDPPRGVLLAGVPGCGKSALARALAAEWAVPLVLLDPGRIYRKYIGESEQRFDAALVTVAAMAPAVLWIDEIEKGFATGGEDGGVSGRVLATFLRWLQDRAPGVFVVATANDVTRLPPELTRKGRFDELFFVDLPDADDRAAIFGAQLRRRGVTLGAADLTRLAATTDGYSGAEIEAAIAAASYAGTITVEAVAVELDEHGAARSFTGRGHRRAPGLGHRARPRRVGAPALRADDVGTGQAVRLAEGEVGVAHQPRVDHRVDVAVGIEVEVGAVDREPDVGHAVVRLGNRQRVDRPGRLVEVGARDVDLGILLVLPRPAQREREHLAGVLVRRHHHARLELGADHPQPGLHVDLEELEVRPVTERHEGQLRLAAVQCLGDVEHRHGRECTTAGSTSGAERRRRPASAPVCSPCSMKTAPLTIVAS